MAKFIDLTGKNFGKLTIIERVNKPDHIKKKYGTYWLCKCQCGNEKIIKGDSLVRGLTQSCGCYSRIQASKHTTIDLTGKKFGRLTVLKRGEMPPHIKHKMVYWLCKCECGNEKTIEGRTLREGKTISCGCYNREKNRGRSPNFKDLTGNKIKMFTVIKRVEKPEGLKSFHTAYWLCECECGNTKIMSTHLLMKRKNPSCGCIKNEYRGNNGHPKNFKDLTGKKFGRLTVIEKTNAPTTVKNKWVSYWLCECECGKRSVVTTGGLNSGKIVSCGCYLKEITSLPNGEAAKNRLFSQYKWFAKNKNISFTISRKKFFELVIQNCFYCGSEPLGKSKSKHNTGDYAYNGLDKINPQNGYILKNVVPCCKKCNIAKHNYSQDDFYKWIEKAYKYLIKKDIIKK